MNQKILIAVLFILAFAVTTAGIIFLNDRYVNIFHFNFTPRGTSQSDSIKSDIPVKASSDTMRISEIQPADTTAPDNSEVITESSADTSGAAYLQKTANVETEEKIQQKIPAETKSDSAYIRWKKSTVKLYEEMDPRKVAKLLESFSDNVARDIIYSMKRKKAAEILSYLDADKVKNITGFN